jgi:hypothetical protein
MLTSYGFSFTSAETPNATDLTLPKGSLLTPNDGSLVKSAEDPTVYLISNQQRYGFTSASVFLGLGLGLGFKFSSVLVVTNPELQELPKATNLSDPNAAHLPGLDILDHGTVYYLGADLQKHPYPSLAIYNSWHIANDFTKVVPINAADGNLPLGGMVVERALQ